jgi:UDP-glucuronate decarboxylase
MIEGIYRFMSFTNGFTGPVNLGNPSEVTILDLAKLIIDLTRSKSKIVFKQLPQDDPERRMPDISLAKSKLGWKPEVHLETGLMKTIEYFEEIINN